MLLFQLLLTAMAVTIASAAPPEVGQTTKVSACQLPAACDVALGHADVAGTWHMPASPHALAAQLAPR